MRKWEYKKIDLNEVPRRGDEIDLLCEVGEEGWELVAVLPNGVAYLKRELGEVATEAAEESGDVERAAPVREERAAAARREEAASGVHVKYRDPVTGETWSGRGRMARWLKEKVEAGEDLEKYLV